MMAKGLIVSLCGAFVMACSGCGGGGGSSPAPTATTSPAPLSVDLSQFHQIDAAAVQEYHLDQAPWATPKVYDESVLATPGAHDLWRAPLSVDEVRNRQTGQVYAAGVDYTATSDGILIPVGSSISTVSNDYPFAVAPNTPAIWQPVTKEGGPLRIGPFYQANQIAVTYTTSAPISAPSQLGALPLTAAKIAEHQATITFYGDSITAGNDSTQNESLRPFQPGYADLVAALTGASVRNLAVGGWSSIDGIANVDAKVNTTASDLVVIAFGMNDASGNIPAQTYEADIRGMISVIRARAPKTEFMLVSSWLANPDWKPANNAILNDYRSALIRIASDTAGVAVADMTQISTDILRRKFYYDMTANGVNHPSDWMYAIYAQVVSAALRKD